MHKPSKHNTKHEVRFIELIKARKTAKRLGIVTWGYMIAKKPEDLKGAIKHARAGTLMPELQAKK